MYKWTRGGHFINISAEIVNILVMEMEYVEFIINNQAVSIKETAGNWVLLLTDDAFAINYIRKAILYNKVPCTTHVDDMSIIRPEEQPNCPTASQKALNPIDQNKEHRQQEGLLREAILESDGRWFAKDTLLLIRLVEENYDEFNRNLKKNVWVKIATTLSTMLNKHITPEQCDAKFKGLKRTYKKIKDHNRLSGNDKKHWEYFTAMDSILGKKPEVTPVATCSSSQGLKVNHKPLTCSRNKINDKENTDESESESSSPGSRKRKRSSDVAQRHEEKLQRMDRFLALYEKHVNHIIHQEANKQ